MKSIIQIAAGAIVGLVLGVSAMSANAQQAPAKPEIVGDGYTMDCYGNGKGGKRTCDMNVITPGHVRRVNYNLYVNNRFQYGIYSWGYNGGGNGENNPDMEDFDLGFRVVR